MHQITYNQKEYTEASKKNMLLAILLGIAGFSFYNVAQKNGISEDKIEKIILNPSNQSKLREYQNWFEKPNDELRKMSLFSGLSDEAIDNIKKEWEYEKNKKPTVGKNREEIINNREEIINKNKEINIIARTLFHESRGEGEIGMRAVASVIYNRSKNRNRTFSQIVTQRNQFCVWKNRDTNFVDESKNYTSPSNQNAWRNSLQIASEMVNGTFSPITKADHFHTNDVSPSWSKGKPFETIGNHKFFTLERQH